MTTPEEAFANGALVHIDSTIRIPIAVLNPAAKVSLHKGEGVVEVRVGDKWSRTELRSRGAVKGGMFSIPQLILDAAKAQGIPVGEMSDDVLASQPLIGEGGPGVPVPWDHRSPQAIIADYFSTRTFPGAVGDEATDDTALFQGILDEAAAHDVQPVFELGRTYRVSGVVRGGGPSEKYRIEGSK